MAWRLTEPFIDMRLTSFKVYLKLFNSDIKVFDKTNIMVLLDYHMVMKKEKGGFFYIGKDVVIFRRVFINHHYRIKAHFVEKI